MVRPLHIVLILGLGSAWSQTTDDIAREIQRLKTQTDDERKGASADSARQAQWRAQSRERLGSMREDARRLSRERDSLRRSLEDEGRPKPPPPVPVAPAVVRKKAFSEILAREIDKASVQLSTELDSGAGLRQRWTGLAKGLRSGSEDPEQALGSFLDDLAERIDLGSRIQARPGVRNEASGAVRRGIWIDLGGSLQVFSGKDGSAALRKTGGPVKDVSDKAAAAAIGRAARILSGEASPAWIYLPVRAEAAR
jgi:hypothetical protein